MNYLWNLLVHFFSANSRHGTHSPFIFKMANEVLYSRSKQRRGNNKREVLLEDLAQYFDVQYVALNSSVGLSRALVLKSSTVGIEQLADLQKKYRYLVLMHIYADKDMKNLWASICRDPRFIVCVDLFYYGLVFYRTEQHKELFKMRFPYWR